MATKKTKKSKPTAKPTVKKPEPTLPKLDPAAQEALTTVEKHVAAIVAVFKEGPVPVTHLYRTSTNIGRTLRATIKERRGDPKARKRATLQARLAKIQAQLKELNEEVES